MSKIDLISKSNVTCVETGSHPTVESFQTACRVNVRAPQQAAMKIAPPQPKRGARQPASASARVASRSTGLASGLRSLAAALTQVLKIVPSKVGARWRRLRCERRAMGCDAWRPTNLLDHLYDQTLDRLGDTRSEPSWWRKVILQAEGDYILPQEKSGDDGDGPHFLRIPSAREWLSDYQVRADLKALATEKILADGAATGELRGRLAQSYAHHTLDDPALAGVRINTVLNGLVAGALSALGPREHVIVSLMRESNLRTQRSHAEVLAAISRIESKLTSRSLENERRCERDSIAPIAPTLPMPISIGLAGVAARA